MRIQLRLTGGCVSKADHVGLVAVSEQKHEHVTSQMKREGPRAMKDSDSQEASLQHEINPSSQSRNRAHTTQCKSGPIPLDEDAFWALFDAGFRSCICSKPLHLATGIKHFEHGDTIKLCDLAPATFTPKYVQRLQEQAQYISGISRQLLDVMPLAQAVSSRFPIDGSHPARHDMLDTDGKASQEIQEYLWKTLANGLTTSCSARRLPALKHPGKPKTAETMLDFSDFLQHSSHQDNGAGQELESSSDRNLIGGTQSEDDLLDFWLNLDDQADISCNNTVSTVAPNGISGTSRKIQANSHDVEAERHEDNMSVFCGCLFEEVQDAAPPQYESRKYSNSLSQMSDVSMLFAHEAPIKYSRIIGQAQAIGGSGWLTQNVIRMHPLRQQHQRNDGVGQGSTEIRDDLYEKPELTRWSETSDASEEPLEDYQQPVTKAHLDDTYSSLLSSTEEDRADGIEISSDYFEEEILSGCRTTSMSIRQDQENSNSSLAEVIGNDHLLWHMWQRRASVAPRGEADVIDMNALFAKDPDMKLFNSRWDLDPSDLSSSSNEDPMLQETGYDQSPRNKATSPMTPNSERRSYFTPPRSASSSSGYVGRSSVDQSRRSSLIKRFTWGGRRPAHQAQTLDVSKLEQRTIEVKKRKTLNDYESMEREASNDDSSDMLF